MRRAFVPMSLPPTRDSDRTSTRVPVARVNRTTTVVLDPYQNVVAVLRCGRAAESAATIVQPMVARPQQAPLEPCAGGRSSSAGGCG